MKLLGSSTQTNGLNISVTGNSFLGSLTHANTATRTYTLPDSDTALIGLNSALTGYAVGSNTALAATDTVLSAFGKIQGQINSFSSGGVSSFNTRTGAVTLTSSDVTTALTYTPINKAGDSGIGNLSMGALTATSGTFFTPGGDTKSLVLSAPQPSTNSTDALTSAYGKVAFNWYSDNWTIAATRGNSTDARSLTFSRNGTNALILNADLSTTFASSVSMGALTATTGTFAPSSNSYSQITLLGATNGNGSQSATFLFSDSGQNSLDISTNYVSGSNLIRFKPGGANVMTAYGYGGVSVGTGSSLSYWMEHINSPQYGISTFYATDLGSSQGAVRLRSGYNIGTAGYANFAIDCSTSSQAYGADPSALSYTQALLINGQSLAAFFASSVSATSFSGAGTGLTGTASSLSIGGNAATATTATNANTPYSASTNSGTIYLTGFTTSGSGYYYLYTNSPVYMNGGIVYASNFGATSDERLKTNITPILNPIDKVKNLNGFYFNWNELAPSLDKTTTQVGVSAQHTLKTFPEAVVEGEEYLSVTYNSFIPLLIECVKEQQKEIEELKRLIHDFTK
jgi:hypothetical protein